MKNDRREIRLGRGIGIMVVAALLFGTLLPLFGNTAMATETEATGTKLTSDGTTYMMPLEIGASNVYGWVRFVDRDAAGNEVKDAQGNVITSPLRDARIRIFNVNPSGSDADITYDYATDPPTVEEVYTNNDGYFYFNINPQPWFFSNQYYAMIYSESHYANVKDSNQYTNQSDEKTFTDADLLAGGCEFTFNDGYPDHPAWNILDSVTEAAEWVKERTGGWTRSKVNVEYIDVDISQYERSSDTIYIDTIEESGNWFDETVYHEYAHAIMHAFWNNYPDSSEDHAIYQETDSGTVITEGWAWFLQYAVGGGSDGAWDTTQTKTRGNELEYGWYPPPPGGWNPDIPGPPSYTPYTPSSRVGLPFGDAYIDSYDNNNNGIIDYDIIEGNFAGTLWDIFDDPYTYDRFYPTDENGISYDHYDDDGLALGFGPIWDVMANKKPITIYKFWDGWFQYSGHASTNYDKH